MSSISSVGSSQGMMMQGMHGMRRPDPAQMAENLFSKLDTSGQGYIQKSDLQTAFDKISSADKAGASTASSIDDLFAQLDGNSDGKVTKQEFSETLRKVGEQLDSQFMQSRMQGGADGMGGMGGAGGMPPPPPRGEGNDAGFSKDELSSQLKEIGSSDSKRSSLITKIVDNFDKADTNGDGKVSFKEAMAYDQSTASTSGAASSQASGDSASSSTTSDQLSNQLLQQIMRLMQAYGAGGASADSSGASVLSTSA